MIFMLDTSEELDAVAAELGCEAVGQLLTPLTQRVRKSDLFGIDNGCFAAFNEVGFLSLLERERPYVKLCKFVTVPDVVCSARRTLEVFRELAFRPELAGYPKALAIQNGQEDLEIPWSQIQAIFIGGDNKFKDSACCAHIIKAAQLLKKWVHVGRVNGKWRFARFMELGADSADGTGISRFTHMRHNIKAFLAHPTFGFEE